MKVKIFNESKHRPFDLIAQKEQDFQDGLVIEMREVEFWLLRMIIDQYHHIQNYLDKLVIEEHKK